MTALVVTFAILIAIAMSGYALWCKIGRASCRERV